MTNNNKIKQKKLKKNKKPNNDRMIFQQSAELESLYKQNMNKTKKKTKNNVRKDEHLIDEGYLYRDEVTKNAEIGKHANKKGNHSIILNKPTLATNKNDISSINYKRDNIANEEDTSVVNVNKGNDEINTNITTNEDNVDLELKVRLDDRSKRLEDSTNHMINSTFLFSNVEKEFIQINQYSPVIIDTLLLEKLSKFDKHRCQKLITNLMEMFKGNNNLETINDYSALNENENENKNNVSSEKLKTKKPSKKNPKKNLTKEFLAKQIANLVWKRLIKNPDRLAEMLNYLISKLIISKINLKIDEDSDFKRIKQNMTDVRKRLLNVTVKSVKKKSNKSLKKKTRGGSTEVIIPKKTTSNTKSSKAIRNGPMKPNVSLTNIKKSNISTNNPFPKTVATQKILTKNKKKKILKKPSSKKTSLNPKTKLRITKNSTVKESLKLNKSLINLNRLPASFTESIIGSVNPAIKKRQLSMINLGATAGHSIKRPVSSTVLNKRVKKKKKLLQMRK